MGDWHGDKNPRWNNGIAKHGDRIFIYKPDHPKANTKGYVGEHVLVMENFIGGPIPNGYLIHHKNENPSDNHLDNLQLCKNDQEHMTIHQRIRALKACGNENWRVCRYCHQYDDPKNLYIKGHLAHHRECDNVAHKDYRNKNKEKDNKYQRDRYARKNTERRMSCN